jgi:hypothetical protein
MKADPAYGKGVAAALAKLAAGASEARGGKPELAAAD